MKIFKIILILTIGLFLTSCEDVIDVDLDTAAPRLVIDASIDWVKNTSGSEQKIKLSTTTGYYNAEFPTVSGADIVVTNTANTVFNFVENPGTGEYICTDFEPIIGETYTLTINLNGETYTATEKLINVPDIKDTIDQNDKGGIMGDNIEITYYYQDDPDHDNYYLNSIITSYIVFPQYEVESDNNQQGNLISEIYWHEDLKPGDVINIKLYGISKRYYKYFNKILQASGNSGGGGMFSTTPTAVRGNIVNQTNGEKFPYGYFRLSEVDTKSYTIK
ncbi:MAG: DUF4249 domain-containing protein [Flavobacteriaceae bacterium]|jgi:hypothetical protein|nr:DUF4249 domain-containing protein [Flavobacteriaceae bacterium]